MGIKKNCYQLLMPWLCLAGILLISIILCLFAGQLTVIEPFLPFIWLLTALLCYVYYGIFSLYKRIKAIHHERLLQQEFENVKQTMNRMHGLYYNRP
ncbi:uncharacterized protein LOC111518969 isoform X2 [Drosophila willistoni]|nr:uncharacterized protein LOC111518969 isoform X2 [Drosophila willistoni]